MKTQSRRRAPQKRAVANRDAILAAAGLEFRQQGYHGARTRAIAAAAQIELGHLNYYFENKDVLWQAVIEEFLVACEVLLSEGAKLVNVTPRETVLDVVQDVLVRFVGAFADDPGMCKLLLGELYESSPRYAWLYAIVGSRLWAAARPLFDVLGAEGYLGGVQPYLVYANLISGALLGFGFREEMLRMDGGNTVVSREEQISALLQPTFTKGDKAKTSAALRR